MGNIRSVIRASMFSLGFFAFVAVANAVDFECTPLPECASLGYEENVRCPKGTFVGCPYDASYGRCLNVSCEDLGFTPENKSSWCSNVVYCPTDAQYTLCAGKCTPCAEGGINVTCPYGSVSRGFDGCGRQCYVCKDCDLDERYNSAVSSCGENEYVAEEIYPQCPENEGKGARFICNGCPEGMVLGDQGSNGQGQCICDQDQGYYEECPTYKGAVCEEVGDCQKAIRGGPKDEDEDGCNDEEWLLSSNVTDEVHFDYLKPDSFNIGSDKVNCVKATNCKSPATNDSNGVSTIYFSREFKTISKVTCYWASGCNQDNDYKTEEECGECKILTDPHESGVYTCGKCECDEKDCFREEPEGFATTEMNGCFKVGSGCVNPYTADTSDNHFLYGEQGECTKVLGCDGNIQGARKNNTFDAAYFSVKDVTNGGQKCYYVDGCKDPYVKQTECTDHQKYVNTKTEVGLTCGKCECDESKGYYKECPTGRGAKCRYENGCYTTLDGCDGENNWVLNSVSNTHFDFGAAAESFNVGTSAVTCKKVTGCSGVDASTDEPSNIHAAFSTDDKTLGKMKCYWENGCSADYQTDPCSGEEEDKQVGVSYTCYKCKVQKCAQDGYYETCPTGAACVDETIGTDVCKKATGCKENDGWFDKNGFPTWFTGETIASFKGIEDSSVKTFSCKKASGCNEDKNYYQDCPGGRISTTNPRRIEKEDLTCYKCDCNENKGYYTDNKESVVTEPVNGCYKNTGVCNVANEYYPETIYNDSDNSNRFSFGDDVSLIYDGTPATTTCKKLVGCNTGNGYQGNECSGASSTEDEDTLGSKHCYKCEGCTPPPGTAPYGECPTPYYKSGEYVDTCGDTAYHKCECNPGKGYITENEKEKAGIIYNTITNEGYDTCYSYRQCDTKQGYYNLIAQYEFDILTYTYRAQYKNYSGYTHYCYKFTGCNENNEYFNRECIAGEEQEVTSSSAPVKPYTRGSWTCHQCRKIPATPPLTCDYAYQDSSGQYAFNFDAFQNAVNEYQNKMDGFDMSSIGCADFAAIDFTSPYDDFGYDPIEGNTKYCTAYERCPQEGWVLDKKDGVTTSDCLTCKVAEGWGIEDSDCSSDGSRVLNLNIGYSYKNETAYPCVCNTNKGYYDQAPEGSAYKNPTTIKTVKCFETSGCANGYVRVNGDDTSCLDYYSLENIVRKFYVGTTEYQCQKVLGCKDGVAKSSVTDEEQQIFELNDQCKYGSHTCYYATGCKGDYEHFDNSGTCTSVYGEKISESVTPPSFAGYVCHLCGCNTNNDWYDAHMCLIVGNYNYGDLSKWKDLLSCGDGYVSQSGGCVPVKCSEKSSEYPLDKCPAMHTCTSSAVEYQDDGETRHVTCYKDNGCDAKRRLYASGECLYDDLICEDVGGGCMRVNCDEDYYFFDTCPEGWVCGYDDEYPVFPGLGCYTVEVCDDNNGWYECEDGCPKGKNVEYSTKQAGCYR